MTIAFTPPYQTISSHGILQYGLAALLQGISQRSVAVSSLIKESARKLLRRVCGHDADRGGA